MKKLLVIDDDAYFLKTIKRIVRTLGDYDADEIPEIKALHRAGFLSQYDAVLLDLHMPKPDGRECLNIIKSTVPSMPVIIITGENNAETAVSLIREGVYDFLTKPIDVNRLAVTLENLFRIKSLEEELDSLTRHMLKNELNEPEIFRNIITQNEALLRCFRYVEAVAKTSKPVLITGETGTGKEMFAEALHKSSMRKGEYIAIDLSGVDDNVFSDTLFGHVKGAFTGAERARQGLLETAADGTIFLDEIGDLTEASQIKLLRLLQSGVYYPIGSDTRKLSSARIIAAVNKSPDALFASGFRNDLYFRLSTHRVELPPLRERRDDIPLLAEYYFKQASSDFNLKIPLDADVVEYLKSYDFPGNIRELKSLIEEAALQASLGIPFHETVLKRTGRHHDDKPECGGLRLSSIFGRVPTLEEVTGRLIDEAMEAAHGSQKKAASLIGLSRQAFNRRLNLRIRK